MQRNVLELAVVGAGPIGLAITAAALRRSDVRVCAVVDTDPSKIGHDAGKLAGAGAWGVDVMGTVPAQARVVAVCTTSSLERLEPMVLELCARGIAVVSTCEELVWPWRRQHARAVRIDNAARAAGVPVLGTGVNPGFVMDALPLMLTGVCHEVKHVRVERVQDAALRRRPFQDKVGVGLSPQEASQGLAARTLGHVGLSESCEMIAARLGIVLDDVVEEMRAITTDCPLSGHGRTIQAGQVIGVEQVVRGIADLESRIELWFRAAFLQPNPADRILIQGNPPIDVTITGGIAGDVATAALILNALQAMPAAAPGLRTMADMPPLASRVTAE